MMRAASGSTDATFSSISSATGSPGTICISTNVTRVTPTKTGTASRSRRAMNPSMPITSTPRLDPDLVHLNPVQLQRIPHDPVHVGLVHQRGLVVVPEEPRGVRDDQPLCLPAQLNLPGRVEGTLRLVHQRVYPLIPIEHAIAGDPEVARAKRLQVVQSARAAAGGY